jgi:hypothetical protein
MVVPGGRGQCIRAPRVIRRVTLALFFVLMSSLGNFRTYNIFKNHIVEFAPASLNQGGMSSEDNAPPSPESLLRFHRHALTSGVNPAGMSVLRTFLFTALFSTASSLVFRIIRWISRIRSLRRSMPVIPVLFPDTSLFRFLLPKKWQTFHIDWHVQHGRIIYRKHNSDVFALVSLFEEDKIFISDPNAIIEVKVTGAHRFQNDSEATGKVSLLSMY